MFVNIYWAVVLRVGLASDKLKHALREKVVFKLILLVESKSLLFTLFVLVPTIGTSLGVLLRLDRLGLLAIFWGIHAESVQNTLFVKVQIRHKFYKRQCVKASKVSLCR